MVITGVGVVSPLGHDLDTLWANVLTGKSGVSRITAFDSSLYDCQIAAQVTGFDATASFPNGKEVRRADRFTQFGVSAGHRALLDSGLDIANSDPNNIGCFIGSGIGGLQTTEEQHNVLLQRGPGRLSPFMIPMLILNMASGLFSIYYGLKGPNTATCSACATSSHAIGEAWRTIKMGDADVMFAGGTEATVVPLGIGGFCAMRAMSTRNDAPEKSSRPFDVGRDGFVMGEGAGVLVLEEYEHAKKRGAKIYAELAGYGNTADASHITAPSPDGEGAARCMKMGLRSAKLNPDDIDYINAHATSTPVGDVCEAQALKGVFGDDVGRVAVSSTKGATGHMLGAAGAVEMAICLKALQTDIAPPTINLEEIDPKATFLNHVANQPREMKIRAIINNSFGFGGHNSCLVATKFA